MGGALAKWVAIARKENPFTKPLDISSRSDVDKTRLDLLRAGGRIPPVAAVAHNTRSPAEITAADSSPKVRSSSLWLPALTAACFQFSALTYISSPDRIGSNAQQLIDHLQG